MSCRCPVVDVCAIVPVRTRAPFDCSCVGEDDGDDQSVETESLAENENQDDSHEDIFLGSCAHTSVTGHTDGQTSSQGRETHTQAGSEVLVASVNGVFVVRHGRTSGRKIDYTNRCEGQP